MYTIITDKRNYVLPVSWSLIMSSLSVVDEGDIVILVLVIMLDDEADRGTEIVDGTTDGDIDDGIDVDRIDGCDGDGKVDVDDADDADNVGRSNVAITECMLIKLHHIYHFQL